MLDIALSSLSIKQKEKKKLLKKVCEFYETIRQPHCLLQWMKFLLGVELAYLSAHHFNLSLRRYNNCTNEQQYLFLGNKECLLCMFDKYNCRCIGGNIIGVSVE